MKMETKPYILKVTEHIFQNPHFFLNPKDFIHIQWLLRSTAGEKNLPSIAAWNVK